jgi:hypothetical protein
VDRSQAEPTADASSPVPNLTLAIRRARVEAAQHSEAMAEMRGGETARLEMFGDALKPVLAQVPDGVDLFDAGLAPGEKPRFFIDMLAFVEMARDRRTYRFLQDTRHGRVTVLETDKLDDVVAAATTYIARRLVERQRALASDRTIEDAARDLLARNAETPAAALSPAAVAATVAPAPASAPPAPIRRRRRGYFATAVMFTVEFLGTIALCLLLIGLGYFLWTIAEHQWALYSQAPAH